MEAAIPRVYSDEKGNQKNIYEVGIPVGFSTAAPEGVEPVHYLNNHVSMVIQYHQNDYLDENGERTVRIVGFEVHPHR